MTIVFPERVVALTLFAVAQDLVGFGNRLELLLNRIALAFRMTIRVPFFGKLAIGPLNLIITGASRHAEGRVIVLESGQRLYLALTVLNSSLLLQLFSHNRELKHAPFRRNWDLDFASKLRLSIVSGSPWAE